MPEQAEIPELFIEKIEMIVAPGTPSPADLNEVAYALVAVTPIHEEEFPGFEGFDPFPAIAPLGGNSQQVDIEARYYSTEAFAVNLFVAYGEEQIDNKNLQELFHDEIEAVANWNIEVDSPEGPLDFHDDNSGRDIIYRIFWSCSLVNMGNSYLAKTFDAFESSDQGSWPSWWRVGGDYLKEYLFNAFQLCRTSQGWRVRSDLSRVGNRMDFIPYSLPDRSEGPMPGEDSSTVREVNPHYETAFRRRPHGIDYTVTVNDVLEIMDDENLDPWDFELPSQWGPDTGNDIPDDLHFIFPQGRQGFCLVALTATYCAWKYPVRWVRIIHGLYETGAFMGRTRLHVADSFQAMFGIGRDGDYSEMQRLFLHSFPGRYRNDDEDFLQLAPDVTAVQGSFVVPLFTETVGFGTVHLVSVDDSFSDEEVSQGNIDAFDIEKFLHSCNPMEAVTLVNDMMGAAIS